MSVRHLLACVPLLLGAAPIALDAQARQVSLDQALREARERSLDLRLAGADVGVARAAYAAAGTPAYNPELDLSVGPSTNPDTSLTSYQVGLSQTLELGGKRGHRRDAAEKRVQAAEDRQARSQQVVARRVQQAFGLALVAQARVATALEADSVAGELRSAAEERLRLGAGTLLEVNVATAAAARERRARLEAESRLATALLELGAAIGLPASDSITPVGNIAPPPTLAMSEDSLVRMALERRADLAALGAEVAAAESDQRLATSLAWPDPTIGASGGQEEEFRVLTFALTVPIPLANHGQGAKAQAAAALDQARIVEAQGRLVVESQVRDAYRALALAIAAEQAFDRDAVERLRENLALAEASFRAGKISLLTYNTVRRDLVEARLDYLDAVAETIERTAALAIATGGDLGGNP